ncbi:1198_t:CDS:2 [Funneliformis mosseae]|uniref:1198_t:CDS:1 n=1 Tax=Funneliformis mosseae TaxID=27381 RepID=A0A9N9CFY3_FUNMO|nr:1198_t:CDS:2 [Funneliformis mosseae]
MSADNENSTALYNLGEIYLNGRIGFEKDQQKGIQYLKLAALKGHSKAKEILKNNDFDLFCQEIESEFNRLNISSDDSNPINLNCTYCKKPFAEELWCKECDPYKTNDESWKRLDSEPMEVVLKRLNGSQNVSTEFLHELKIHWDICNSYNSALKFYGLTKDPLAYRCMNAIPIQRPTINDLRAIWVFWYNSIYYYEGFKNDKKYGYYGREIKKAFEEADKEIVNISTSYKNNPDAIYTSRAFTFNNLAKPTNSSLITSYLKKDDGDSQIIDLEFLAQNITDDLNL